MIEHQIDCEPKWIDIVRLTREDNLETLRPELEKMAKLADIVRQAQKKGKILTLHPDGKIEEED